MTVGKGVDRFDSLKYRLAIRGGLVLSRDPVAAPPGSIMNRRTSKWLGLLLALLLVAAGCGSDDSDDSSSESDSEETTSGDSDDAEAADDADSGDDEPAEETSGEPIKIGALTSLTGPFTPWGIHVSAGMQLAVDEINAAGGVDGRMLELITVDDQSDAEEGVVQMERLHEEGVVAIGGTISSGVGQATAALAEEAQVPLFLSKAGSSAILTTDSRYTFRTCLPAAPMIAKPWVTYAEQQGYSKVGAIVADYAWGQSFKSAAEDAFGAADGIELQVEVAPVPEQDFTTYLRSLDDFEPELILATGHPPGTGPILVQTADLGFDVDVSGPSSSLSAVLEGVGDAAIDRYTDYSCADYFSDSYADLAARYIAASGNAFMEDDAVAGFGVVTMVADAVANVGDDPAAIAEYLHTQTYDLPGMAAPVSWTEWGELATSQLLLIRVGPGPAPEGLNEAGDWWPEQLLLSEPLEPFVP